MILLIRLFRKRQKTDTIGFLQEHPLLPLDGLLSFNCHPTSFLGESGGGCLRQDQAGEILIQSVTPGLAPDLAGG